MRKLGIPPENLDPLRYAGPRLNLTPVVQAKRRPQVYDRDYPLFTYWRVDAPVSGPGDEGENWYLSRFAYDGDPTYDPGDAVWVMIGTSSTSVEFRTDDNNIVTPNLGIIDLDGIIVDNATNAKPLFTDGATANTVRYELQVAAAVPASPGDPNDAGIASFDDNQFTVDPTTGFVQMIGGVGPPTLTLTGDDATPVGPDGTGTINIQGSIVNNATNAKPLFVDGNAGANLLELELQVAVDRTGAPANKNDAGICSFDDTMFVVDANGFVQLAGGGLAVDQINVQFNTAPGTDPVVPTAAGQITINGSVVPNATNAATPVATHSRSANTFDIEVQLATERTGAPANTNDAGICSFDDTAFAVDANGYVTFIGAGGTATNIGVDANTPPGTDPVLPDGGGTITFTGAQVATGTIGANVIRTNSLAANTVTIEIQRSTAVAAADSTKNGVSHYNSNQFTVAATGFVTLIGGANLPVVQTLTGDNATAVGPDASGNIDLIGLAVDNATHAKPLFFTGSAGTNSFSVDIQVATERTGAPGDKDDAGICSFDDTQFSVDDDGFVQLLGTPINPTGNLFDFDDFLGQKDIDGAGGQSKLGWVATGATIVEWNPNITTEAGHPGIVRIQNTGANQTGTLALGVHAGTPNDGAGLTLGAGILTITWIAKLVQLSSAGDNFTINLGIGIGAAVSGASAGQAITDGMFFSYNHAVNGGSWTITNRDTSVDTTANTNNLADTDWHRFDVVVNAAATSVAYYIDGVQVTNSPIATNIPTSTDLGAIAQSVKTSHTTTTDFYVDLCVIDYQLTSARY